MILTLGIECFRFTPCTVLTNAHLLPNVSQTLSSAPSLPTGPPYLQTDASRKHCHQRHHGESPICDFCCQLGLSNLWVLSEHGSPRAFFLVVFHFFLMHSQLHPKSTFKKWMLRKTNKRLLERYVKCAFNPTHNMNWCDWRFLELDWVEVEDEVLSRTWAKSSCANANSAFQVLKYTDGMVTMGQGYLSHLVTQRLFLAALGFFSHDEAKPSDCAQRLFKSHVLL